MKWPVYWSRGGSRIGKSPRPTFSVALIGNPNCGKTTIFNALTGAHQRTGNWPGVTVERRAGTFRERGTTVEVVDLPGLYALATVPSQGMAVDEKITSEFVLSGGADVFLSIVDASCLDRHLYLTMQLLEMGTKVVLALNMMDVAKAKGIHIDIDALSRALGCPVVGLQANKAAGTDALKQCLSGGQFSCLHQAKGAHVRHWPPALQQAVHKLADIISLSSSASLPSALLPEQAAICLLEADLASALLTHGPAWLDGLAPQVVQAAVQQQNQVMETVGEEADILLADARYQEIEHILTLCTTQTAPTRPDWALRIDHIVLHRLLGVPVFLAVMYALFVFSINVGGAFQGFFDGVGQTVCVEGMAHVLEQVSAPAWVVALLAYGAGKGISTTLAFVPVIGAMFLFLELLEDSGYMARAAFVVDRAMRALGLPGKAFVPMVVGFGCNVPAVMAARTLEQPRDRILTVMMAPFMSCGARLAIYAVFTAAFFPQGGAHVIFVLYVLGLAMAVLTGTMLRHTVLKGVASPLVMELPPYHLPQWHTIVKQAGRRIYGFVVRAGKVIVPVSMVIGMLNAIQLDGTLAPFDSGEGSLLSVAAQWATPIFAPMGIRADNWPATVGLITGGLAKEVVVGTLNTLYSQMAHLAPTDGGAPFDLWGGLAAACASVPENLAQLLSAFQNPVLAKAPVLPMAQSVYGVMYQKFDGQVGAFAYLLFVLLYFPCVSTTAAMLRELNKGWSLFSVCWMTGVAYGTAVFFYQAMTWQRHPGASLSWILAVLAAFAMTFFSLRWYVGKLPAGQGGKGPPSGGHAALPLQEEAGK